MTKQATIETVSRIFKLDQTILSDPDPEMTAEEVKLFYANQYPDLLNSKTEEKTGKDGKPIFSFIKQTRTLG